VQTPRHAASKSLATVDAAGHDNVDAAAAAAAADDDDDDDSEPSVYRPDLHLDDLSTLHDPATASAAYRKVMSGQFMVFQLYGTRQRKVEC